MRSPKRQRLSVADLGCGFLWNPCARTILRALPGSTFEIIGPLSPIGGALTLPDFARQHGLAPKTLHNRISCGELDLDGLEKRRGRWIVVDPVRFEKAVTGSK
jgi:hypothetical protein